MPQIEALRLVHRTFVPLFQFSFLGMSGKKMQIWPFVKHMGKHSAPTQPTHLFSSPVFPDNDQAPEFGLNMCEHVCLGGTNKT